MQNARLHRWPQLLAAWVVTAALVAVTAAIVNAQPPAPSQSPPGGARDSIRGGPFSLEQLPPQIPGGEQDFTPGARGSAR
jgi:hypothetical protein